MVISTRLNGFAAASLTSLAFLGTVLVSGCGDSNPQSKTAAAPARTADKSDGLPTASIGNASGTAPAAPEGNAEQAADNAVALAEAQASKGEAPETVVQEMIKLFAQPLPKGSPQAQAERLRWRNQKLIDMAHQVIAQTHQDKAREPLFNKAVQFLTRARIDLATNGSQEDAKALYDDAEALYRRDPNSAAAAEGAFAVARLAHTNAQLSRSEPKFIQQFAIQSRLFATRFPRDGRAVQLLWAAGQTCELYHLDAEAVSCFSLLRENFTKSPQAVQANAVLRRLELKGKTLDLGGETRDGGFVKMDDYRGKPTLVVFWASDSEPFQAMLPQLQSVLRPYGKAGLSVIGVCLDENDKAMEEFIERNGLTWTQIFYSDPNRRHWEHPLVQAYGVHDIPTIWLVNAEGVVVETHVTPDSLDGQLKYLAASANRTSRQ
jgi:peroxiredoxin